MRLKKNLIEDGGLWLRALDDRNKTSHMYDEDTAEEILAKIRDQYFALLKQFLQAMEDEAAK